MYHTGIDPESGTAVYVPRSDRDKGLQKALLLWHQPGERKKVLEALRELGKEDRAAELLGSGGVQCGKKRTVTDNNGNQRGTRRRTAPAKR
jgi:hypothetical protein